METEILDLKKEEITINKSEEDAKSLSSRSGLPKDVKDRIMKGSLKKAKSTSNIPMDAKETIMNSRPASIKSSIQEETEVKQNSYSSSWWPSFITGKKEPEQASKTLEETANIVDVEPESLKSNDENNETENNSKPSWTNYFSLGSSKSEPSEKDEENLKQVKEIEQGTPNKDENLIMNLVLPKYKKEIYLHRLKNHKNKSISKDNRSMLDIGKVWNGFSNFISPPSPSIIKKISLVQLLRLIKL